MINLINAYGTGMNEKMDEAKPVLKGFERSGGGSTWFNSKSSISY